MAALEQDPWIPLVDDREGGPVKGCVVNIRSCPEDAKLAALELTVLVRCGCDKFLNTLGRDRAHGALLAESRGWVWHGGEWHCPSCWGEYSPAD